MLYLHWCVYWLLVGTSEIVFTTMLPSFTYDNLFSYLTVVHYNGVVACNLGLPGLFLLLNATECQLLSTIMLLDKIMVVSSHFFSMHVSSTSLLIISTSFLNPTYLFW